MDTGDDRDVAGVKSVVQAIRILNAVAQLAGPASLKQIAGRAGMAPSKVHRYLQSMCAGDLVHQTTKSGAYDLGVGALRLGLAALNRVDLVNRAGDALLSLVQVVKADAFLSVWGENGPTTVRFERSEQPSAAMLGAGMSLPLLSSATGRVFMAFIQPERASPVARLQAGEDWESAVQNIEPELLRIRADGFAYSVGEIVSGRRCIAAPIISFDDQIVAAVSVVSTNPNCTTPDSPIVLSLLDFCKRHSVRKRGYAEETQIEKKIAV
ncbi:IclR family transcriptional regulator [Hyphococcus sp.]|uniref:IclR family transcriptional regulator n=1 Tax=Hyphococcus sp. TaxID=2038636 RepID=UPI00208D4F26|nr:MAG: IclR family transcriptional regulator [Marinicaulis sp.]